MGGVADVELARARERALSGGSHQGVRPAIRQSWRRARGHGLRADAYLPPVPLSDGEVRHQQETHPLATVWPVLLDSLRWLTREPGCLLFVSDAEGYLLWTRGGHEARRAAERVHLVPGALWSEAAAGTSGVGTALAMRRPFQVRGAEHYLSIATGYTCTAAPIRDPLTGQLLGAIDLTCPTGEVSPHLFALLATTARLAEAQLGAIRQRELARIRGKYAERLTRWVGARAALVDPTGTVVESTPRGWLPRHIGPLDEGDQVLDDGQPVAVERLVPHGPVIIVARENSADVLRFQALDRARARLTVAGVTHQLTRRQSEIVAILLAHPAGLDGAELARRLYGPGGKQTTLRAEVSRLRPTLGHRLASEPYRITGECTADFLQPERLTANPRSLLPGSVSPGVHALRAWLD